MIFICGSQKKQNAQPSVCSRKSIQILNLWNAWHTLVLKQQFCLPEIQVYQIVYIFIWQLSKQFIFRMLFWIFFSPAYCLLIRWLREKGLNLEDTTMKIYIQHWRETYQMHKINPGPEFGTSISMKMFKMFWKMETPSFTWGFKISTNAARPPVCTEYCVADCGCRTKAECMFSRHEALGSIPSTRKYTKAMRYSTKICKNGGRASDD